MTALYMDGFDHYGPQSTAVIAGGVAAMLDGNWATVGGGNAFTNGAFTLGPPAWGPARTGPNCLCLNQIGQASARKILTTAQTKLLVSVAFAIDSLPTSQGGQYIVDFRDNSNIVLYSLGFNSSGQLILFNGPQTSVNVTSAGQVIRARTWHFFEMELDLSAGTFVLRADDPTGTGTATLTASVATSGSVQSIALGQYNNVSSFNLVPIQWDDLYVRNASGSVNNGFQGDRRVATIYADADTPVSGWTPSYYKEFGAGILRLAYAVPNTNTPVNADAYVRTPMASSLAIGAQDFTLETFVRFDQVAPTNGYSSIMGQWSTVSDQRSWRLVLGSQGFNQGCIQFDTCTDGHPGTIETPILFPWQPETNVWYYVCVCRVAGELLLFINGEQLGVPISDTRTYFTPTGSQVIGAELAGNPVVAGTGTVGRFDETRFTNGVGRYTTSFATPTQPFPRGTLLDPDWSSVVLLSGYDSGVTDESSFQRTLTAVGGAVSFIPADGPDVGAFSTVNKTTPDDNTFIAAELTSAAGVLTMTTQPTNGNTVTVGTTDGTTPAVYTFKTAVTVAYDVLIDTTAQNTLLNLYNAINLGAGIGTKYGAGTLVNFDVTASQLPAGQIEVGANTAGTAGNAIVTTSTGTAAVWGASTLQGGSNIPGPTNFRLQRPPSNTTIISALQTVVRATKTDSGLGTVQTAFIGPLGGTVTGTAHPLSISTDYYNDIIETDPDTSGPLSPTTVIGGQLQINRTA